MVFPYKLYFISIVTHMDVVMYGSVFIHLSIEFVAAISTVLLIYVFPPCCLFLYSNMCMSQYPVCEESFILYWHYSASVIFWFASIFIHIINIALTHIICNNYFMRWCIHYFFLVISPLGMISIQRVLLGLEICIDYIYWS